MPQVIGWIGLGAMGSRMVRRLHESHHVVTFDVDAAALKSAAEAGMEILASPAQVAARSDIVMVSLPTPDIVRKVALGEDGIVFGGRARIYVDLSTTGPRVAKDVASHLEPRGIKALDAPVSGGPAGAASGSLAIMASGDAASFEVVRPLLERIGKNTKLVGDQVGQGQALKLVNNLMAAANFAVASECFVLGVKAGLDPDMMVDVVNKSSGRSFVSETFMPKAVLKRDFDFGFRLDLMAKDMRLALEEAEASGATMFTCAAARQIYSYAMAHGVASRDITTLIEVIEGWADARVESRTHSRP